MARKLQVVIHDAFNITRMPGQAGYLPRTMVGLHVAGVRPRCIMRQRFILTRFSVREIGASDIALSNTGRRLPARLAIFCSPLPVDGVALRS